MVLGVFSQGNDALGQACLLFSILWKVAAKLNQFIALNGYQRIYALIEN